MAKNKRGNFTLYKAKKYCLNPKRLANGEIVGADCNMCVHKNQQKVQDSTRIRQQTKKIKTYKQGDMVSYNLKRHLLTHHKKDWEEYLNLMQKSSEELSRGRDCLKDQESATYKFLNYFPSSKSIFNGTKNSLPCVFMIKNPAIVEVIINEIFFQQDNSKYAGNVKGAASSIVLFEPFFNENRMNAGDSDQGNQNADRDEDDIHPDAYIVRFKDEDVANLTFKLLCRNFNFEQIESYFIIESEKLLSHQVVRINASEASLMARAYVGLSLDMISDLMEDAYTYSVGLDAATNTQKKIAP